MRPTIADRQGNHAVGHAGEYPDGKLERTARVLDAYQILAREAERLGRLRAHEGGVVPGELGERIGKLLQPPVVRKPAVMKRRRRQEDDLEAAARLLLSRGCAADQASECRKGLLRQIGHNIRKLAAGEKPVVQHAVPLPVELRLAE